jgi:pre-mRNA-splicing factor 38A
MANTTDSDARNIHGTDPQYLIEKILRLKIHDARYWKEHCFALSAETMVDKAVDLKYVGGTFGGNRQPTQFMCLILKMLQIQPEKEIIIEFISNDDYKYVVVLGAFYLRLTGKATDVYKYLEPLLSDYRKIRVKNATGHFEMVHVDELVAKFLTEDYFFDIALPRLPSRRSLELANVLEPRRSALDDMHLLEGDEEEGEVEADKVTDKSKDKENKDKDKQKDKEKESEKDKEKERRKRSASRSDSSRRSRERRRRSRSSSRRKDDRREKRSRSRDRRSKSRSRDRRRSHDRHRRSRS